ncbi:Calcineurin-like phosphoesterase [Rhodovulum sp. ES.010]|uniref:metallophosphoesterase n=1 Tax=Rhodovulum sp. ES.010 TaxID=1882821 RepID=UPI000925EFCC|nr:metallophosphoesterase [Rhodovulum sp. ES.010]SIO08264.1 Calcineurin-like phosphoesterase [Rhodovulum sp. ES.010]
MPTRRNVMLRSAAAGLLAPMAGARSARAGAPAAGLRFGVVADPQYAPVPPQGTRHYAQSLGKLAQAIEAFNRRDLAFSVTLGDIIDRHWDSYDRILPLYDRLEAPHAVVLGNHDFEVAPEHVHAVPRRLGLARRHYDFAARDVRFLVLDGTEISLFAHPRGSARHDAAARRLAAMEAAGAVNAKPWNGGLSDAQLAWAEDVIADARAKGQRVVAMGHYPLYPADPHNCWDDARLVDLFSGYENVVMYLNGHNHAGNYGRAGGTHYVTFKGMVETADTTAHAVVAIDDDRIEIEGVGREDSRVLPV